jgi:hypothetical protein
MNSFTEDLPMETEMMKRVHSFAQMTNNATEAVITQMVRSRPKPARLARGNEIRKHSRKKRKESLGGDYG